MQVSKQVSLFMDEFLSKYHIRISEGLQCIALPVHNSRNMQTGS